MPRVNQAYAEDWLETEIGRGDDSYRRGPVRHIKRVPKGPSCDNCGLETEFLFQGFRSIKSARAKFRLHEQVHVSAQGAQFIGTRRRGPGRQRGIVAKFCRDDQLVRIQLEGNADWSTYHMDFWEPDNKNGERLKTLCSPFQTEPAMVCQRCRNPSNLEIEEILKSRGM